MNQKYLYVGPKNYCLHGNNPLRVSDSSTYKVVTLEDLALDPEIGKLTGYVQAIGQKSWNAGPYSREESIQFTRAYLQEQRRLGGDADFEIYKELPLEYEFTVYSNLGPLQNNRNH